MGDQGTQAEVFARDAQEWQSWQQAPWGRLRYSLVAHVLDGHISNLGDGLRILDAGGGDGSDSLRLAALGHHVTVLDYSDEMLALARAAADDRGIADRVTTVKATVEDLLERPVSPFDVVMCHFVLGYVADPARCVRKLASQLRPGGLISLISQNPASEILMKVVRDQDPAGALAAVDQAATHGVVFDHDIALIPAVDAEGYVAEAGLELVHRYGGRIFMDLLADNEAKGDPTIYSKFEALEFELCDRSPYRDIGRFWQLIARRPG